MPLKFKFWFEIPPTLQFDIANLNINLNDGFENLWFSILVQRIIYIIFFKSLNKKSYTYRVIFKMHRAGKIVVNSSIIKQFMIFKKVKVCGWNLVHRIPQTFSLIHIDIREPNIIRCVSIYQDVTKVVFSWTCLVVVDIKVDPFVVPRKTDRCFEADWLKYILSILMITYNIGYIYLTSKCM